MLTRVWTVVYTLVCVNQIREIQSDCGVPVGNDGRIIGGEDVGRYTYPWYATLRPRVLPTITACGGTLITADYVLTAAHCFGVLPNESNERKYIVSLGVYNQCRRESTQQDFAVSRVDIHPQYRDVENFNDIAIMRLSTPASSFTPACLPGTARLIRFSRRPYRRPGRPPPAPPQQQQQTQSQSQSQSQSRQYGLIMGFGTTRSGDDRSTPCTMRQATVEVFTRQQCQNTRTPRRISSEPSIVCAGVMQGGKDTCQGDSGGGLFEDQNGRYDVIGIVSFGYGCGLPSLPGIYTRVSSFLPWIESIIGTTAGSSNRNASVGTSTAITATRSEAPPMWWLWFG